MSDFSVSNLEELGQLLDLLIAKGVTAFKIGGIEIMRPLIIEPPKSPGSKADELQEETDTLFHSSR